MEKRFLLPDLIRITATILVFVGHLYRPLITLFPFYQITLSGLGVSLFFILSGIVLEIKYRNIEINFKNFIKKRFIRIYPTYLLSLLFSLLIYVVKGSINVSDFDVINLICSLTFSCALWGRWGGPFLQTSWFLGIIFIFYLIYPILSKSFKKHPHLTITGLFFLSIFAKFMIIFFVDISLVYTTIDWFPLSRIFEFGLGIYLVNIINLNFWKIIREENKKFNIISLLAKISFPFFLIHGVLIFSINSFINFGISSFFSKLIYTFLSFLISWLIFIIAEWLFRNKFFKKII